MMPVIDGIKMACDACIRGHRGSVCRHTDRPLLAVRPRGRPKSKRHGTSMSLSEVMEHPQSRSDQLRRCCEVPSCACLQIDGFVLIPAGCKVSDPDVSRETVATVSSDVSRSAIPHVSTIPATSEFSPAMNRGSYAPNKTPQHNSPSRSAVLPNKALSPQLQSSSSTAIALDLPCTCADPCPCPNCPANSDGELRSGRRLEHSCCTSSASNAHRDVAQVQAAGPCGSCLPCIIAPFEDNSAFQRAHQSRRSSETSARAPSNFLIELATASPASLLPLVDSESPFPVQEQTWTQASPCPSLEGSNAGHPNSIEFNGILSSMDVEDGSRISNAELLANGSGPYLLMPTAQQMATWHFTHIHNPAIRRWFQSRRALPP